MTSRMLRIVGERERSGGLYSSQVVLHAFYLEEQRRATQTRGSGALFCNSAVSRDVRKMLTQLFIIWGERERAPP